MSGYNFNQFPHMNIGEHNLPHGWEMRLDPGTNRPYYIDHTTQSTTWDPPRRHMMHSDFMPPSYPAPTGRVREIPVIRQSGSPRRTESPKMEHSMPQTQPHNNGSQPKVYNIPVQFVDNAGRSSPSHRNSPSRFEGRHSPRSSSPWQHDRPQGPYGWTGWVGDSPQGQAFPHQSRQQPPTPPFPTEGMSTHMTYPEGNRFQPDHARGENSHINYPQGIVNQPPPVTGGGPMAGAQHASSPPRHVAPEPQDQAMPHTREIHVHTRDAQNGQGNNGASNTQYTVDDGKHEDVNLQTEALPRPTNKATDTLKAEERKATRSPSPAPAHLSPLEQVELLASEIKGLEEKVNSFKGQKTDKEYAYIEEMLTRCLLKLDRIESNGKDEVRQARKAAVRTVQATLDHLELKAMSNAMSDEPSDASKGEAMAAEAAKNTEEQGKEQRGNQNDVTMEDASASQPASSAGKKDPSHVNDMLVDGAVQC